MNSSPVRIDVEQEMSKTLVIHKSLGQEVIVTTVDKVRLCLMVNRDCLIAKREWVLPLGILVTLLTAFFAADFRDFGVKAPVWEAIFILASLVCALWLAKSLFTAWQNRGAGGINKIVEELKVSTSDHTVQTQVNENTAS